MAYVLQSHFMEDTKPCLVQPFKARAHDFLVMLIQDRKNGKDF